MPATWTPDLTARFIHLLVDVVERLGNGYEGNIKKATWQSIPTRFNQDRLGGERFSKKQLQSKLTELKKKYRVFAMLKNNSGFGWDPVTNIPTAPESVWAEVLAALPQAKEFRTRPLLMYAELDKILNRSLATGSYAAHARGSQPPVRDQPSGSPRPRRPPRVVSSSSELNSGSTDTVRERTLSVEAASKFLSPDESSEDDEPNSENVWEGPSRSQQSIAASSDAGTPSRRRSTGEQMAEALGRLATAHMSLAEASLLRQRTLQNGQSTQADVAISHFMRLFGNSVSAQRRVLFCNTLATRADIVTTFCGLDDEGRSYMVHEYLAGMDDRDGEEESSDRDVAGEDD